MKKNIEKYHRDFQNLLNTVKAVDNRGRNMDFARGIEVSCGLIKRHSAAGGRVFFIGNGGSSAISSHMAIDFWKNVGIEAVSFSDSSLLTCISNDFGYDYVFAKPIEFFTRNKENWF